MSGKRIRADICPYCDGTILAPDRLSVHIERDHPERGIEAVPPIKDRVDENALRLDWTDFQPENDRDQMALALLVAGVVIEHDKDGAELPGDLVRLDYPTADAVLEALGSVGIGLSALRSPDTETAGEAG
jgi:hypothetical protein